MPSTASILSTSFPGASMRSFDAGDHVERPGHDIGGAHHPRPGSARTLGPWPSPSAMSTPPSSSSARQDGRDRVVAFARPSPCAAFALAVEATAGAVVAVNEFRVRAAGAENATRINRVPKDRMRGRQSHAAPLLETGSCFQRTDIGGSRHRPKVRIRAPAPPVALRGA